MIVSWVVVVLKDRVDPVPASPITPVADDVEAEPETTVRAILGVASTSRVPTIDVITTVEVLIPDSTPDDPPLSGESEVPPAEGLPPPTADPVAPEKDMMTTPGEPPAWVSLSPGADDDPPGLGVASVEEDAASADPVADENSGAPAAAVPPMPVTTPVPLRAISAVVVVDPVDTEDTAPEPEATEIPKLFEVAEPETSPCPPAVTVVLSDGADAWVRGDPVALLAPAENVSSDVEAETSAETAEVPAAEDAPAPAKNGTLESTPVPVEAVTEDPEVVMEEEWLVVPVEVAATPRRSPGVPVAAWVPTPEVGAASRTPGAPSAMLEPTPAVGAE
jgi:nicotinate-nucleotide--dimethylbenzimidazole phosphoribosyltransferase